MSNDEENYEIVCVWELKNFNRNCVGVELWSPVFVLNALDNSRWRIALCVDNYDNNSSYFFNFRLKCVSDEIPTNKIDCELSIMDFNGSPLQKTQEKSCNFSTFGYYSLESLKVVEDIFGLSECKFFPKNILTVRCRMQTNSSQSGKIIPELHSSCIQIERSSFLWSIENFCQLQPFQKSKMHLMQNDSNSPVISFEFFFDEYERFQVKVAPNSCCSPIDASFKISIVDANRQVCKTEDFSFCKSFTSLSLKRKELVDNKPLYLPMGILSLQVECFFTIKEKIVENTEQFSYQDLYAIGDTAKNPVFTETIPSKTPVKDDSYDDKCNSSSHREFFQNMMHLYKEGLFSDADLVVFGEETFPVHRCFLSARIPTFKTLFMEAQEKKCHISNMFPDTMRRLLLFAYSDRLEENMSCGDALHLYLAAKRESFDELERVTYSFFKASLSASNVCQLFLTQANLFLGDSELKSAVVDFILSHDDKVIGSEEWKELQKNYVQFAVEILNKLYERNLQRNSS